ncbi:MAG: SGNH/GDSL hydrolase family protein [Clostridia bacterium]
MLFNLDKYLSPVWKGDTVYDESVMIVENRDGSMDPVFLLYPATHVLSVTDCQFTKRYEDGKDYYLKDGKLVIIPDGGIYRFRYNEYYPLTNENKDVFGIKDDRFVLWKEGDYFHRRQIAVTYRHETDDSLPVPVYKGGALKKTVRKLENKENINILFYGDSITFGWNSSGMSDSAPFLPTWGMLTCMGLLKAYGYDRIIKDGEDTDGTKGSIRYINTAVSGTNVKWGEANAKALVSDKHPDLVFIAFGMNNPGMDPETVKEMTGSIMDITKKGNRDCEFILVTTTLPNPEIIHCMGHRELFIPKMQELAAEVPGTCVCDMTTMHKAFLVRKPYCHMTGNDVNHPNDFLIRVHAQVMLAALVRGDH